MFKQGQETGEEKLSRKITETEFWKGLAVVLLSLFSCGIILWMTITMEILFETRRIMIENHERLLIIERILNEYSRRLPDADPSNGSR